MEEKQEKLPEEALEHWDPKADAVEEDVQLERGDGFAMFTAGCLTVGLPITLLIIFICVVALLLFSR